MIVGETRIFPIIAGSISRVRTPAVLNGALERAGVDAAIIPVQVSLDNLGGVINAFRCMENLGGFIVSNPHKTAVAALCDKISDRARVTGSVNAVRREPDGSLVADMFDGMGFILGMQSNGLDARGCRALLVGGGNAAMAVAVSLAEAGVSKLTVADEVSAKAQNIVARVSAAFPTLCCRVGVADPVGHDLIINAVSVDTWVAGSPPFELARLASGMIAAETMSKPDNTPFLEAAAARGCKVHYGRYMLDSQLRLISDFIGIAPMQADLQLV